MLTHHDTILCAHCVTPIAQIMSETKSANTHLSANVQPHSLDKVCVTFVHNVSSYAIQHSAGRKSDESS